VDSMTLSAEQREFIVKTLASAYEPLKRLRAETGDNRNCGDVARAVEGVRRYIEFEWNRQSGGGATTQEAR